MEEIKNMTIEELGRDLFAIYHGTHFKLVLGGDVSEDNIVFQNTLDELITRTQSPIVQAMKNVPTTSLSYQNKEMFLWYGKWTVTESEYGETLISTDSESEAVQALLRE